MDAAQVSPVSAWMAVSREQNDHPLVCRHTVRGVGLAILLMNSGRWPRASSYQQVLAAPL
jgi:hypothetical protein